MPSLRKQLRSILQGRVCLVGVGNVEYGDDGVGVRLAEELGSARSSRAAFGAPANGRPGDPIISQPVGEGADRSNRGGCARQVVVAGNAPEHHLTFLTRGAFDAVLFLDAVDFGSAPGSVALLNSGEMAARLPQVSTHKLSLGLLAQLVEGSGRTKAWLLGVQPESVRREVGISRAVAATLDCLAALLAEEPEEALA